MQRYKILVSGIVQGVGFRYQTKALADRLNLTGKVRNLTDGNVEIYIQGSIENIDLFIIGMDDFRFSRISNKKIMEVDKIVHEEIFKVVY